MPMKIETNTNQGVPSPHSGHFQDETLTAVDPPRRSSSNGDHFNEKGGDYKMKRSDSPKDTFHEGRHRFGQDIIPPYHDRRTVVLCFDGTGDQFDDDNSNVVNFFSTLKKDDPCNQIVYYQAGIGTYTIPQVAKPMAAKFKKLMDTMVGVHLDAHVMSGYEFLMQNYQDGDKICIFGFSRGAYTARALAGMLHKVGLLPKSNYQQVPFAYRMYSREDELGWRQSILFKKSFSIDVDIEILGVWDTVGSVGILPKRLPFTTSNTHVRFFRHALSLDERRVRFTPSFWHRPTADDFKNGIRRHHWQRKKPTRNMTLRDLENAYSDGTKHMTDVEEVWFAGCHCDVGGGAVVNDTRHALARIPLRWMIRQCFLIDTGILFHRSMVKVMGLEPDSLWPVVKPRPEAATQLTKQPSEKRNLLSVECMDFVSEEEEDLADILCKKLDMLEKAKSWWILEVLPQKIRYQRDLDDVWTKRYSINLGKGRLIPKQSTGVKVHRSVKILMDKTGYKPKAQLMVEPTWVS